MTASRDIVLGVSGGIAAYKALPLLRDLTEAGFSVWPVLTQNATRFVGAMSFSALAGRAAVVDLWSAASAGEIGHVELAHRAALVVVAPCTADTLARLADGRADDPLCAVVLATRAPVLIAPAMETAMWEHESTQSALARLQRRGVQVVPPASGALASGRSGMGRMAEPELIHEEVLRLLSVQDLANKRVVVTAGPTREAFDPARFLSNASSGKMGYALARLARRRGAAVTLISGPTTLAPPHGVDVVPITTTADLLAACRAQVSGADVLIMAAAPADWRPKSYRAEKHKKGAVAGLTLELEPTPDVLGELQAHEHCLVVGFAAESHDLEANARAKLERKHMHFIVANAIGKDDTGFASDTNAALILEAARGSGAHATNVPLMPKAQLAALILDRIAARLAAGA